MTERLQALIAEARAEGLAFDPSRSLGAVLAKKERRARRERVVRRSMVALSGAAFFALLLCRVSVAPASASASVAPEARQEIAARALDDGGFARD